MLIYPHEPNNHFFYQLKFFHLDSYLNKPLKLLFHDKMIYHMDLYRIKKEDELYEIGFEEYLKKGNLCLIEWPEIAIKIIDKDFIHIKLKEISKTKRSIEIKSI